MSDIKFACPQCQQHIQCEPAYAGMEVGCPTCATRIVVPGTAPAPVPVSVMAAASPPPMPSRMSSAPAPAAVSAPAASASGGCPSCGVALPRGAVLCTRCGYNLATGKRNVAGRPAPRGKAMAPSGSTVWYKTPYPYLGAYALVLLSLYLIGRSNPPIMLAFAAMAGLYVFAVWITTVFFAFKDSALKGILCMCIGIYALYWVYKESENNFLKAANGLVLLLYLVVFVAAKAHNLSGQ